MALLICQTCPRYEPDAGSFGPQLDQALATATAETGLTPRVRHVQCVGGCPTPGNVALDGLGKARVRISSIDVTDAAALLEAEAAYNTSATGNPGEWAVPGSLAARITAVSLKTSYDPESARPSRFTSSPTA